MGCGVVCCWQQAVQCRPGQGGCALSPQQLGQSADFGTESCPSRYGGRELPKGWWGRHGEGAASGRAGWLQWVPWAGLGAHHQRSRPSSMLKPGQAAPCAGLWDSPGPCSRDLNMLTALSARAGVISSPGQGTLQLPAPMKEAQGKPLEPTRPPPWRPPCPPRLPGQYVPVSTECPSARSGPIAAIQAGSCSWQKCQQMPQNNKSPPALALPCLRHWVAVHKVLGDFTKGCKATPWAFGGESNGGTDRGAPDF